MEGGQDAKPETTPQKTENSIQYNIEPTVQKANPGNNINGSPEKIENKEEEKKGNIIVPEVVVAVNASKPPVAIEEEDVESDLDEDEEMTDQETESILRLMTSGDRFHKVKKRGKIRPKHIQLSGDMTALAYSNIKQKRGGSGLLCGRGKSAVDDEEVHMADIVEVRKGQDTDTFIKARRRAHRPVDENCSFSLVIGKDRKTLDLLAHTRDRRDKWVQGITHLVNKYKDLGYKETWDMWIRDTYRSADKDKNGRLSFNEVYDLIHHMNIDIDEQEAQKIFHEANFRTEGSPDAEEMLDEDEFIKLYEILSRRPEVEVVFKKFTGGLQFMNEQQLLRFLNEEQRMPEANYEFCRNVIDEFEMVTETKNAGRLSVAGFRAMLYSVQHQLFDKCHREVYQDMNQPLAHYWINSSHNTYLAQDQLFGPSQVECYIKVLQNGCRCVELDCWDGPDGDPIVYHGHTLTSKILFKDIIEAVRDYSFVSSEYPVILSLENHCSIDQQKVMANHMQTILGDMLYTTPAPDDIQELPSPESLKSKVLIKAKKLPPGNDGEVSDEDEAAEMEDESVKQDVSKKGSHKLKMAQELSDMVVFCVSVHFKGFQYAKDNYNCCQMSSYSEGKTEDLIDELPMDFVDLNKHQLSRIYPGALRTDSSNYNPMPAFNCGCQIVALNHQTPDEYMRLYYGRFLDNGGSGYILKPEFLRNKLTEFHHRGPFPEEWIQRVTIRIISAYHLPKKQDAGVSSITDPYVKVDIIGVPSDKESRQTRVIKNNGFLPVWNETVRFDVLVPDLALVRFQVMDECSGADPLLAQYCLPFTSIREGFRFIRLKTPEEIELPFSSLFVHVKKSQHSRES